MPVLPAACDDCGLVFLPNAMRAENGGRIYIADEANVTIECPRCGGTGRFSAGLYEATAEGLRVIATSAKSADSLERLRRLLEDARAKHSSREAVAEAIEQDAPEFAALAALVRRLRGVPIIAWITLALAIVGLQLAMSTDQQLKDIDSTVNRILQQVSQPEVPTPAIQAAPRVGRNDPCPCGSGKKYKRCHGNGLGSNAGSSRASGG